MLNKKTGIMSKRELEELKDAYRDVFGEDDQVKNDDSVAFKRRLIYLMKKFSTKNVGNPDNGVMKVDTIKSEYHRIIG